MSRGEKELLTDAERLNRNGIYEDKTYKRIRPDSFAASPEPPAGRRSHPRSGSSEIINFVSPIHPPNLSGDVMSIRAGEEVEDALGVQQVALVVDRLPHLEQGQGRVVADPVRLGGLLVINPDQGDPVTSHLLSNSLQNAQHSVTGLAVLRI